MSKIMLSVPRKLRKLEIGDDFEYVGTEDTIAETLAGLNRMDNTKIEIIVTSTGYKTRRGEVFTVTRTK